MSYSNTSSTIVRLRAQSSRMIYNDSLIGNRTWAWHPPITQSLAPVMWLREILVVREYSDRNCAATSVNCNSSRFVISSSQISHRVAGPFLMLYCRFSHNLRAYHSNLLILISQWKRKLEEERRNCERNKEKRKRDRESYSNKVSQAKLFQPS